MKKKLLTIFAVLALVVAMVFSVVACGGKPGNDKRPPVTPPDTDDPVDLTELASESFTAMADGIKGLMQAALDATNEKSYDATIFVNVKVGEGDPIDVKLRVAGTFGTKNSGLLDVIVGDTSYLTLYTADNMVYLGEALTQENKNWFKIDAVKDAAMVNKFFPQLLDVLAEKNDENKNLYQQINSKIGTYFTVIPLLSGMLLVTDQEDGIVKTESGGAVTYANQVTFSKIQELLPALSGPPFNLNIEEMLAGLGDFQGLIDTVCTIIFGGNLNALLGKDGASIPADAAPAIELTHTTKGGQLTDLELKYANDIAFDASKPAEKTAIEVAFGFKNVNVTSSSSTAIIDSATKAAAEAGKEPAIKLTIGADIPGKDVGATVEAYVVPDVSLVVNRYAVVDGKHVKIASETHEGHTDACEHYYKVDTVDMGGAKAYAIAKDNKTGNAINLGCDADVSGMADGTVVLKFELEGLYALMGIENADGLPTQYQKTFQLWGGDKEEPEVNPEDPEADPENPKEDDKQPAADPTNLIDKVVALFGQKFEIGKVMALLTPGMDFLKGIYNDVLEPNLVKGEEGTKTATVNVAAILKGLVTNDTIKGSDSLKINKEEHLTTYLTSLQGVANLVDNIMRYTDPEKKELQKGEAYTKEELVALVKKYAGIDITDKAFEDTTLVLTGIRGNKDADNGLGFTAELKSEGKTVLKLTMKVDIVDAAAIPPQTVIGENFEGAELEKVPDIDDATGEQKVDEDGNLLYKDGEALDNINDLAKAILDAYKAKEKAAA